MAERHPYSPGGPGGIANAITQLRSSFPATVSSETLKQLGIAPKNESYVINVLRYVGAIDKTGKQTEKAATVFSQHDDADFQREFAALLKEAYSDLFALHKEVAWQLPLGKLIGFFRTTDKTTALVGKLQAQTFQLLAGFAGHGSVPEPAPPRVPASPRTPKTRLPRSLKEKNEGPTQNGRDREFGLTVRIEVNLPPAGDQDTYDRIFRSIRENLLNVPKA